MRKVGLVDLEKIEVGTKVEYSFFKNITFEGTDEEHVILKDKHGNINKVFKSLFVKYGQVAEV